MKFTTERSIVDNRITGYVTEINGKEVRIDRYASWSLCGVRYNEVCYAVFVRELMVERVQFSKLSQAKAFVAEMFGA